MNIIVNSDRTVEKEYTEKDGSQNENRVTELDFTLPVEYSGEGFVPKIAFITEDGNFSDYIDNGIYILKNNITKYREVVCFVWLTDSVNNIDFRSQTFSLEFYYNEDPSDYIPEEEEKSQIELLIEELDEKIQEVTELEENVYTKDETYSKSETYSKEETYNKEEIDNMVLGGDIDLSGYQEKIDNNHKLDADLVDDTNSTHKFTNLVEKSTWNGKYSKPVNGIPKSDLSSEVQTSLGKADTAIQDISGKQDITDNNLQTTNKTITGAINEIDSIARGANQALVYLNYSAMITVFNSALSTAYSVGQNIYIKTVEVPDLWISSIESTSSTYTYTTDEAFITALETNGYVQVGYYKLSALETQKADLTGYYQKPNGGIPKADLDSSVQASLGKADSAIQSHQDISGKVDKTSFVYDSSTDTLTITIN